jgi:predicted tellurium resistance membrane protein TerC
MEWLEWLVSLWSLTLLEIVLGVDNLVLLAILTERLSPKDRKLARFYGLTLAWVTRLLLLAAAVWITKLTYPVLTLAQHSFSYRDIFLTLGGGFLLVKATQEIHQEVLHDEEQAVTQSQKTSLFWWVVVQVGLMDIIFSLDSVLTAVGLTQDFTVMVISISCAIVLMILASQSLCQIIERYPTLKMLALSFLLLIGMVLIADGFSFHVPRGYVYVAMMFSLTVETLNLITHHQRKKKRKSR